MKGMSKLSSLALCGILATRDAMRAKEQKVFRGLAPKNTEGHVCGYEPPKPRRASKLVRQGAMPSLRVRKKILSRVLANR